MWRRDKEIIGRRRCGGGANKRVFWTGEIRRLMLGRELRVPSKESTGVEKAGIEGGSCRWAWELACGEG